MGIYLNPGNSGFAEILQSDYVDKTGMIALMNEVVGTKRKLACVSRPRRFGKSYAAQMLVAYYDCTCDSHELFAGKEIASTESYERHLNQYNVIALDITNFTSEVKTKQGDFREVPRMIEAAIRRDLDAAGCDGGSTLNDALIHYAEKPGGRKFIFIIDEWDALIREAKDDPQAQDIYLNLLRGWFKNGNFTPRAVAAAYMTGILPIKKDGSQSAISEFEEYTMLHPYQFGKFVGFTEDEVRELCRKYHVSFDSMKKWYDGYTLKRVGSVYNPNSVMKAIRYDDFKSYWTETSAFDGLKRYIGSGYSGMARTIAELIAGIEVKVDPLGFANDFTTFRSKDDVLTLMIHLGYLSYQSERGMVRIPNEEIKLEFQKSVREVEHKETMKRLAESDQLFLDTIEGKEEAVAAQIEKIHAEETSPLHYHTEASLRSVIKLAYYTYRDNYLQWEELPAGVGFADIVYLPKPESLWPVLVVELKWNRSAEGAIEQILRKNYPDSLKGYGGDILLVGVNYDKNAPSGERKHSCRIVKMEEEAT